MVLKLTGAKIKRVMNNIAFYSLFVK